MKLKLLVYVTNDLNKLGEPLLSTEHHQSREVVSRLVEQSQEFKIVVCVLEYGVERLLSRTLSLSPLVANSLASSTREKFIFNFMRLFTWFNNQKNEGKESEALSQISALKNSVDSIDMFLTNIASKSYEHLPSLAVHKADLSAESRPIVYAGSWTRQSFDEMLYDVDYTQTFYAGDIDKSIAAKWLIAGGIIERSWEEGPGDEGHYRISLPQKHIFISLLNEEESKSPMAKVYESFSRWDNDLNDLSERIIGKDQAKIIHNTRSFNWNLEASRYDTNMANIIGPEYLKDLANDEDSLSGPMATAAAESTRKMDKF